MQDTLYPVDYAEGRVEQNTFVAKVYGWMSIGLLLTAIVALATVNTPSLIAAIFLNKALFFGLIIGELLLVVVLSAAINRIPAGAATALFLLYAAINGLTLSVIFLVYTQASIASTFFVTAGTFGALSLYGYFTKRDLTTIGNLCGMALFGLIIASVVNLFVANSTLYWVVTYAGVVIFVGLTAYDTQRIRRMAESVSVVQDGQEAAIGRLSVIGALILYLDFINLFLLLLRLLGRRR